MNRPSIRAGIAVAVVAASLLLVPGGRAEAVPGAHPRLLFDAAGATALRTRVTSGVPAQAWANLRAKADRHMVQVQPVNAARYQGGQNEMPTYLIDLSMAYVLSGDPQYGRRAVDMMLALEAIGWPVWLSGDGVARELGNGDFSRGLALAFDWTYDLMTPAERSLLVTSIVAQLPPLNANGVHEYTLFSCLDPDWWGNGAQNNWLGVCGGGAGLLLLAIEGEDGAGDLSAAITRARNRTMQHLSGLPLTGPTNPNYGSLGDGYEGVTYTLYGLKNSLPFVHAWKRLRGEDLSNPALRNVPVWLAYEQQPGEGSRFVPRNDSGSPALFMHEIGPMFFELRPADGVSGWLWDHTAGPQGDHIFGRTTPPATTLYDDRPDEQWIHFFGAYSAEAFTIIYWRSAAESPRTSPAAVAPLGRHHPEHGLVTFRTGFSGTRADVTGVYEARRRNPGGHAQIDLGHFSLYGYGAKWALDSGYTGGGKVGTTVMNDNGVAAGHNVPILDGARYTQYPGGLNTSAQTVPHFVDVPGGSFIRSDLRAAYGPVPANIPWADRNLLFSRVPGEPVITAVADNLNRDHLPHEYSWQVHTDGTHAFSLTGPASFLSVAPNGASMAGGVAEANATRVIAAYPWQKAVYSVDNPAAHLLVTSRDPALAKRNRMDHLAVLAITPTGALPATVTPIAGMGGTASSVTWSSGEVLVASAAHGSSGVAAPIEVTGAFGKVSVGKGESVLDRGTRLAARGITYVEASSPATVAVGGDEVEASGPAGTTYRVFAPQPVTSVTVNGASVPFTRTGQHLTF